LLPKTPKPQNNLLIINSIKVQFKRLDLNFWGFEVLRRLI